MEVIPTKPKKLKLRNLCLEGGGILATAYLGALIELDKRVDLSKIKNYAGSSAGAMACGVLACGASIEFLTAAFATVDFASFIDYGYKFNIPYNICKHLGVCPGTVFEKWYSAEIEKLTGSADITLEQIYTKYNKHIIIAATSLNTRKVRYFDYKTDPELTLVRAVRMSMSIPIIFQPVKYNNDLWVDGGTIDNFPIKAFHRNNTYDDKIRSKTLGIMLTTTDDINPPLVTGLWSFIVAVIECMLTPHTDAQDMANTITINCGAISSINFDITQEQKELLVTAGSDAIIEYFKS